jgi:hypothetical protein
MIYFAIIGKVLSSLNSDVEGGQHIPSSPLAEVSPIGIKGEIIMHYFTHLPLQVNSNNLSAHQSLYLHFLKDMHRQLNELN